MRENKVKRGMKTETRNWLAIAVFIISIIMIKCPEKVISICGYSLFFSTIFFGFEKPSCKERGKSVL